MFRNIIKTSVAIVLFSLATQVIADTDNAALPGSRLDNGVETFRIGCPGNPGQTTMDMNICYGEMKAQVKTIKNRYLTAAQKRITEGSDEPAGQIRKVLDAFDAENKAWDSLEEKASTATATFWEGGSMRGIMGADREIRLIELRIHNQWANWLQYEDSTPALLPEPKFDHEK